MNMVDTDKILHSAQLLVCVGGLATATSVLAGGGAIVAGVLSWREIRKRLPAKTKPLAEEVAGALKDGFEAHRATHDQRIIIPNMIEASLPDPETIMDSGMEAKPLVAAMVKTIKKHGDSEQNLDGNIALFKTLLVSIFAKLLNNKTFTDIFDPAYKRTMLSDNKEIKATGARTEAKVDNVPQAVFDLLVQYGLLGQDRISVDDLIDLASRFDAHDLKNPGALIGFLSNKAEEFHSFKAQIDGLDERVPALANLKGAAQDAAVRLNFDEVEELMARVDEVETEISAETKLVRAKNALLRGRVEDAYTHLCTAADSIANIDPVQAAERRLDYSDLLYDHGMRYGGLGLERAADILTQALRVLSKEETSKLWANGKNRLASAFRMWGDRTPGGLGIERLNKSVFFYNQALEIRTQNAHSTDWAMTKQNLGNALYALGERADVESGIDLLATAEAAFEDALTVYSAKKHAKEWAMTNQNLAIALETRGE